MQILHVTKQELYPNFGYCDQITQTIKIRQDLPKLMKAFILAHEQYHMQDRNLATESMIKKEWNANWVGFKKHPLGALLTIIYSLALYRLKYYYERWRTNK